MMPSSSFGRDSMPTALRSPAGCVAGGAASCCDDEAADALVVAGRDCCVDDDAVALVASEVSDCTTGRYVSTCPPSTKINTLTSFCFLRAMSRRILVGRSRAKSGLRQARRGVSRRQARPSSRTA
jgi:hypothetical protein